MVTAKSDAINDRFPPVSDAFDISRGQNHHPAGTRHRERNEAIQCPARLAGLVGLRSQ